jgi:hypothetical protein
MVRVSLWISLLETQVVMDGFHFEKSVKLRFLAVFVLQRLRVFVNSFWINKRTCLRHRGIELLGVRISVRVTPGLGARIVTPFFRFFKLFEPLDSHARLLSAPPF